jgi:uncharacterized damage-inducible protein DinB
LDVLRWQKDPGAGKPENHNCGQYLTASENLLRHPVIHWVTLNLLKRRDLRGVRQNTSAGPRTLRSRIPPSNFITVTPSNSSAPEVVEAFTGEARKLLKHEYLQKIERCLRELSDEQVWWRANSESNSIGNLLLHLSGNARQWIVCGLGGVPDKRRRQEEFDERSMIPRTELLARLRTTIEEVDQVLAGFDGTRILERKIIQGMDVTALEAIFHVTEHFSMHTGHIILLTKQLTAQDLRFYNL